MSMWDQVWIVTGTDLVLSNMKRSGGWVRGAGEKSGPELEGKSPGEG